MRMTITPATGDRKARITKSNNRNNHAISWSRNGKTVKIASKTEPSLRRAIEIANTELDRM